MLDPGILDSIRSDARRLDGPDLDSRAGDPDPQRVASRSRCRRIRPRGVPRIAVIQGAPVDRDGCSPWAILPKIPPNPVETLSPMMEIARLPRCSATGID